MSARIRALQQRKVITVGAMRAITEAADTAGRDLTAEEQSQFDAHAATVRALNASIEREQSLALEEAGLNAAPAGAAAGTDAQGRSVAVVGTAAAGHVTTEENVAQDPTRGFKSRGDFFRAVRHAAVASSNGEAVDRRLRIGASVPGTYSGEGSGADGGFAIPPAYSTDIWRQSLEEGSLLPMTANTEITGNSMVFPKDETTPWGSSGVKAYWRGEAAAANLSKLDLGTNMLRLKELMVMVPITNELLEDAPALGSYLTPLAAEAIQWKTNEAILFGTGGMQPVGAMTSSALIVVDKEAGQAAGSLLQPNISRMRSRLKVAELKNAVWIGNPDILPALESMTVGQIPIFLPPIDGLRAAYDGALNGRPLILSEHANGLGQQSDLSLLALSGYRTITKAGGIQTATSMHLYFDANATAFRFIFRIDGEPIIKSPIKAPAGKSANSRSYFVTMGARA
jgi:HK97 family phage major capsid protein